MTRCISFLLFLSIAGVFNASPLSGAQDKIVLKQGDPIVGEIQRIDPNGNILIAFERGTVPVPAANIAEVKMTERPNFAKGREANQAVRDSEAIELLQPLVDQFLGIQESWVAQSASLLAHSLARSGKTFEANQLTERVINLYKDTPYALQGTMAQARIALGTGDSQKALDLATEIIDAVPASPTPDTRAMSILGDAYFLQGEAFKAKNAHADAYQAFLKVATIYYNPPSRSKSALTLAEQIKRDNPKVYVP